MDVYGPLNGASAMAANGLVRYGLGAAFPLFTIPSMFRPAPSFEFHMLTTPIFKCMKG